MPKATSHLNFRTMRLKGLCHSTSYTYLYFTFSMADATVGSVILPPFFINKTLVSSLPIGDTADGVSTSFPAFQPLRLSCNGNFFQVKTNPAIVAALYFFVLWLQESRGYISSRTIFFRNKHRTWLQQVLRLSEMMKAQRSL